VWANYLGLPGHPHHANARKYLPRGTGAIMGFGIQGGGDAGIRFINSVKPASHLPDVADRDQALKASPGQTRKSDYEHA